MSKQIFINLAVENLSKAEQFYTALGFVNNPQFSDDTAKCMVWSEHIFVMIMTHEKFAGFVTKPLSDKRSTIGCIFSLSVESVDEMNAMVTNGLQAGGTEPTEMKDYGFMQQRTLEDLDGHIWEIFFMDVSMFPSDTAVQ